MTEREAGIVLVGIGGYGKTFVNALLDNRERRDFRITGVVSSSLGAGHPRLGDLQALGVPLHRTLESFAAAGGRADLAVISSPIHLHAAQTCLALSLGMNVMCEKPIAGTVQEGLLIRAARDRAGKFAAIGYDWSFSDSIQALKEDIRAGLFGRPRRLKTLVLWPRGDAYYRRNRWAGRQRAESGEWVLDSPVNNATAHYLHNMLYLLGRTTDTSAEPVSVQAELYRVNPIENYDTGALRVRTAGGAEVLFFSSHAVPETVGPVSCYEFEHARVTCVNRAEPFVAEFADGRRKSYPTPSTEATRTKKLWDCIDAVRGGGGIVCGPEAALAQTLCINGAQESPEEITVFPDDLVRRCAGEGDAGEVSWVAGLPEALTGCYENAVLPAEAGHAWARAGRPVALDGYCWFPSRPRGG